MAIYGIGAFQGTDVSQEFIQRSVIYIGWGCEEARELEQFLRVLRPGDIVYIKSCSPRSHYISVKAIGLVTDAQPFKIGDDCWARNVRWFDANPFLIQKPIEKNNVRYNTMYEEFHPDVQSAIFDSVLSCEKGSGEKMSAK